MIIRWLLLILGGVLLGGIVHLATVILLPRTATQDAYARLTPIAPVNTVVALPAPSPRRRSCRSWIRPSPAPCAATISRKDP